MGLVQWLFDTEGFLARWQSGEWPETLGWLHIGSDLAVWTACIVIAAILGVFAWRRDASLPRSLWLFALFALFGGTLHLVDVILFWAPLYNLAAVIKIATALAAWGAVGALTAALRRARRASEQAGAYERQLRELQERRQADQSLERKFQEADKLESLGVLAGGIAHDFNNLLTGMLGNANLAAMELPADAPVQHYLREIEQAANRAAELCKQMLAYAGKGRVAVERVDLSGLVRDMASLLQVSIGKNVVLRLELGEGLPPVLGDSVQLRQVVMNLARNAAEALENETGVVRIATARARVDAAFLRDTVFASERMPEGDCVLLEVSDTGAGIDPATLRRIFEPFFSTKFTGRGLGLAAVLGIVRSHDGALKVSSTPGRGTTFELFFPPAPPRSEETPAAPRAAWRGWGRVLAVDDEPAVRTLLTHMLKALGFEVLVADNGRAALECLREEGRDIRLVFLDLTMPEMDGAAVFHEMTALHPEIPIVLMSGGNRSAAAAELVERGRAGFLAKPFNIDQLEQQARAALEE